MNLDTIQLREAVRRGVISADELQEIAAWQTQSVLIASRAPLLCRTLHETFGENPPECEPDHLHDVDCISAQVAWLRDRLEVTDRILRQAEALNAYRLSLQPPDCYKRVMTEVLTQASA